MKTRSALRIRASAPENFQMALSTQTGRRVFSEPAIRGNLWEFFTPVKADRLTLAGPDPYRSDGLLHCGHTRRYSIILSARVSSSLLILTPSAFAVLRLITK